MSGSSEETPLREIATLFLKLGFTAFGGPAAHIAMMEDEVVRRRGWLTREEFLDYVGATNLIPGPNSTELAIHIGHARAGWPGLLVAGACFILPASLIVTTLAWAYVKYGRLPDVAGVLYGVKPVVIAVVIQALWRLTRTAVKSRSLAALGVAALVAYALGVNELAVLAAVGLAAVALRAAEGRPRQELPEQQSTRALSMPLPFVATTAGATGAIAFGLWPLFWFFVKIGSVLFGSGYVLLAFLRSGLVVDRGWLTEGQLIDAVAIGQVTPGPVFTTATFIGYILARGGGAVVATVGIFLPAFFFVALSGPLIPRVRRSPTASAVLDGVNVGSLALMAVVTAQLARVALIDPITLLLAMASAIALLTTRVNSVWLVVAGALIGAIA